MSLEAALNYIRELQPRCMEHGWCLMLGGGVLNKGHSDNDIDIIAYPRTRASCRRDLLQLLPPGEWSSVDVADVYGYDVDGLGRVELIFQTYVPV